MKKISNTNSKFNCRAITCFAVMAACALVLYPEISEAATTTDDASKIKGHVALTGVYDHLKGLISGVVGKIIAITSLLFGMVTAAATSNIKIIIPTGGIALAVGTGPSVIESVVGAIF